MRPMFAVLLPLLALPAGLGAQTHWPESEAAQIALARSAAPPEISADAAVWIPRDGRYVRAAEGRNEAACILLRDHPESMYPICYDAAGTRTVLPIQLKEIELREKGLDEDAIEAEIGAAIARGELRPPERGALAYMMSPHQILYSSPTGQRVGTWNPHIMLYLPFATAEDTAAERVPGFSIMVRPGALMAHVVFIVNDWAKSAG